jgi:hypothetical protein
MIAPEAGLSVSRQCALLGIARGSFYYRPRPESAEELELLKRLDRIFTRHPVYGSRRLQVALLREGISVGRRRVRRLMRKRDSTSQDIVTAVRQLVLIANDELIAGILNRNKLTTGRLYTHFSRPFWTGQSLAYPVVQKSGAAANWPRSRCRDRCSRKILMLVARLRAPPAPA